MRYFIYADPHWSSYSSIVRSRGEKYSTRLNNLIKTINWVELEAQKQNCDAIVCLGDFFDKSELNSEEITALQEIKWANMRHYMLVGNHEMGRNNLELSSSHLFALIPHIDIIDSPYMFNEENGTSIMFLPYILESNRTPLKEYFNGMEHLERNIIFSHNDLSGIQMGNFISTMGFSVDEIEECCDLFINGHLHNGCDVGKKIINVGNITGQNFSEDAFRYEHRALVLDTDNKSLSSIVCPYALNFYKVDLTHLQLTIDDKFIQDTLSSLKAPAVATIKVNPQIDFMVRDLLTTCNNIIECRLITEGVQGAEVIQSISNEVQLDHIQKFQMYVVENIGKDELILNELERVSK